MGLDLDLSLAGGEGPIRFSGFNHLLRGRMHVHPMGDQALLELTLAGGEVARYLVSFGTLPPLLTELRAAAAAMHRRARLGPDRGAAALRALCAEALAPQRVDMLVEPTTGDWVFIDQFPDHAPLALRLSGVQMAGVIEDLREAARTWSH